MTLLTGRIIRIRAGYFIRLKEYIKRNKPLSIFLSVLLFGVLSGALLSSQIELSEEITSKLLTDYISSREHAGYFDILSSSLLPSLMFLTAAYVLSFFIFGSFILPLLPFFRGIGIGIYAGGLLSVFNFKGALYWILISLPGFIISSFALSSGITASLSLTNTLLFQFRNTTPVFNLSKHARNLCYDYLIILFITFISAAVEAALCCLFTPLLGI